MEDVAVGDPGGCLGWRVSEHLLFVMVDGRVVVPALLLDEKRLWSISMDTHES